MPTSGLNNQGIAHVGFRAGGQPFCGSRRALICCAAVDAHKWPRLCVKCEARMIKMNERRKPVATSQ